VRNDLIARRLREENYLLNKYPQAADDHLPTIIDAKFSQLSLAQTAALTYDRKTSETGFPNPACRHLLLVVLLTGLRKSVFGAGWFRGGQFVVLVSRVHGLVMIE
jgi:hypothetical protein